MSGLVKAKEYKVADSNLALFGTPLEKEVKLAAALSDPEWNEMNKAKPTVGLRCWRVEKFTVKKWPQNRIGEFHTGDSYILLSTYKVEDKFLYDIHFWLGAETTQDEAGTAAYKTVELDDALGQVPVQHREVQDHESSLFLSYFKNKGGIRILAGGIDSGFNHVKPKEFKPRLLHVKGRRNVRVTEVPITSKSLNSGDVFVLDAGLKLYQWQGAKCGGQERVKAASLIQALDDERGGKPVKVIVGENDKEESDAAEFWKALGGKGPIAPADDTDDSWEDAKPPKLFRITDAKGGKITMEPAGQGIIPLSKLDTNDAFLLDVGCELFVWIGKKASAQEKAQGMAMAQQYITNNKLPNWLPISKLLEGAENEVFKTYMSGEKRKFGTPVAPRKH